LYCTKGEEFMIDIATKITQDHHETLEWCSSIMSGNDHYVYRPHEGIVGMRNHYLHEVMHHRSHQLEY